MRIGKLFRLSQLLLIPLLVISSFYFFYNTYCFQWIPLFVLFWISMRWVPSKLSSKGVSINKYIRTKFFNAKIENKSDGNNRGENDSGNYKENLIMNTRICEDIVLMIAYTFTVMLYSTSLLKDSLNWYKYIINERYQTNFVVDEIVDYYSIDNNALDWYLYSQANYYVTLLMITWLSPRKKDIGIMTAHHVFTLIAVLAASQFDMKVEASMVLFLHDICDVPLQLMTLAHKLKTNLWDVIFCAIFFFSHVLFRVIIFPFIAITTTVNHRNASEASNWIAIIPCIPLWCFHVFWAYKLGRIILKYYKTGEAKDYREQKKQKK